MKSLDVEKSNDFCLDLVYSMQQGVWETVLSILENWFQFGLLECELARI